MFKEDIENEVFLVLPDRSIRKYEFIVAGTDGSLNKNLRVPVKTVRANTPVSLEITFTIPGIHII